MGLLLPLVQFKANRIVLGEALTLPGALPGALGWVVAGLLALVLLVGLSQRRTSPHSHLIDFRRVPGFELVDLRRVGLLAQWGIFRKPLGGATV